MHSLDTKYKAIVHYRHFLPSLRKVAALYNVSKSSLQRWLVNGGIPVHKQRSKKQLSQDISTAISKALTFNPFLTANELVHVLSNDLQITISRSTTKRYIHQAGFSNKKAFRISSRSHDPNDVLSFCGDYLKASPKIVCIDEAGFYIGDNRRRGYAPVGKRLNVASSPQLRRTRISLALAVSKEGVIGYKLMMKSFNKQTFIDFVNSLPRAVGTTTVILDNIPFHKSKETQQAFQAKGYRPLYILPYSPKLNAIENVFSVLKSRYRSLCPMTSAPAATNFSYTRLLEDVICGVGSLERFFRRVDDIVREAMSNRGRQFSGYD